MHRNLRLLLAAFIGGIGRALARTVERTSGMNKFVQFTLLASCLAVAAHAQLLSGPAYNGLSSSQSGNLCLAVTGSSGSLSQLTGYPLITTGCQAGSAAQLFYMNPPNSAGQTVPGPIHVGTGNSSYCVQIVQATGSAVLAQCAASASAPGYAAQQFIPGVYGEIIWAGTTSVLGTASTFNAAQGSQVSLQDDAFGSSPYQVWSSKPPAAAPPVAPGGVTCICGLDSLGYLLDQNHNRIAGAGPGNQFEYVSAGHIILIGASNIILNGGGNIILNGGGNVVGVNGAALQPLVVDSQGRVYKVVSNDGGSLTITNAAGNIVAAGAGNIVAAGAGNISGSVQATLVVTGPLSKAIISQDGGGFQLINEKGNGITAQTLPTAAVLSGMVPANSETLQALYTVDSFQGTLNAMPKNPPAGATTASNYTLTSLKSSGNTYAWAMGSALTFTWTGSGTPTSGQSVSFFLKAGTSSSTSNQMPLKTSLTLLSAGYTASTGAASVQLTAPNGLVANTRYTLTLQNDQSPGEIQTMPVTIVAAPGTAAPVTSLPVTPAAVYTLGHFTTTANPLAWSTATALPVSWTSTGKPAANQTVSIWVSWPGLNAPVGLTQVLASNAATNVPPPNVSASTPATLILRNDSNTSQTLQFPVNLVVAAKSTTTPVTTAPVSITSFAPVSPTWKNNTGMTFTWTYSGTALQSQSIFVGLNVGGTNLNLCPGTPLANKTCQTQVYPWSSLIKTTMSGTVVLADASTNRAISFTAPITLSVK